MRTIVLSDGYCAYHNMSSLVQSECLVLVKLSAQPGQMHEVVIFMIIRAVHNGGYDFLNHSSEFYIMCEYEGWRIGNLVDAFKLRLKEDLSISR